MGVYANLDCSMERIKVSIVAKDPQTYRVDYSDTFSQVAKLFQFFLFISLSSLKNCPSYQLDITNPFLHGDLQEEVYMENLLGFLSQGGMRKLFIRRCLSMA